MPVATLTAGSPPMANAAWSDASGFGTSPAILAVTSGVQAITAGLSQGAATVQTLRFMRAFGGTVGDPSSPLICDATDGTAAEWTSSASTEGRIVHDGTRTVNHQVGTAVGRVDNYHHMGPGTSNLLSGDYRFCKFFAGKVNVNANMGSTSTVIDVYTGNDTVIEYKSTALSVLNVYGGSCVLKRTASTVNVYGGTLTIDIDSGTTAAVNIFNGTVILVSGGTITAMTGKSGTLILNRLRADTTITTATHGFGLTFTDVGGGGVLTVGTDVRLDESTNRLT